MNTIAIDCGASFLKTALLENGEILKHIDIPMKTLRNDRNIFSPEKIEEIITNVKKAISELSDGIDEYNLCISNEMHGFILLKKDASYFTDYISWQNEYGNIEYNGIKSCELLKTDKFKDCILQTGMSVRAGLPSSNLIYLSNAYPFEEQLYFYTLGDCIFKKVFGIEPICHISNAAASGLYDIENHKWISDILNYVNYNLIMPKVGDEVITTDYGNKKVHIFPAIGDYQAALLGAGINDGKDISFNLGTGAQVSVISDNAVFSDKYQVLPFFNGKYLFRVAHLPSGRALNVYFRFFKDVLNSFDVQVDDSKIWDIILNNIKDDNSDNNISCSMGFFENSADTCTKGFIKDIGEFDFSFSNLVSAVMKQEADNFIKASYKVCNNREEIKRVIFSGGIAKRIDYIRHSIINSFNDEVEVIMALNETLVGLEKYTGI